MNVKYICSFMRELIARYLNSELSKDEVIDLLINKYHLEEIIEMDSELLVDSYIAIKHLIEEGFETTNAELIYLKYCLEGTREFSREDRDRFIIQQYKNS